MMRCLRCLLLVSGLVAALMALEGCGAPAGCNSGLVLSVGPAAAVADHAAAVPGNQVRFSGVARAVASPGCAVPALALLEYAVWSNPDPTNIQISSANDATNGTAVCMGATNGAVTLTGVFNPITLSGPAGSGAGGTTKAVSLTCN